MLLAEPLPQAVRELFVTIQHDLFNLGGELAMPSYELLKRRRPLRLDQALADHNATLPRLKGIHPARRHRSSALPTSAALSPAAPNAVVGPGRR